MFEIAAPIQTPTKCEVRSIIGFLNAKGERPAEIHKQIFVVYGKVINRQNVTNWYRKFSERRTYVLGEQKSGRPSMIPYNPVPRLHTLRTGDADLRFYVTTVQDG